MSGVWGARLERKKLGRFSLQTSAVFGSEDDWKGCSRLLDQARGSSGNVIGAQVCMIEAGSKEISGRAEEKLREANTDNGGIQIDDFTVDIRCV